MCPTYPNTTLTASSEGATEQSEVRVLLGRYDRLRAQIGGIAVQAGDVAAKLCGPVPVPDSKQQGIPAPNGVLNELRMCAEEMERLADEAMGSLSRMHKALG